jgi:hypothetical protein
VKSALPAAEAAVKILKKEELFMLLKTGTVMDPIFWTV